ncbi:MAG: AI-2E family transporter [Alphaproteobacteria bacterium]|nr:AI-2E family transporter [Alphaproteobacteria bacterium]MBM3624714.1 AI-2E family transporter [Alphaproteobacteria bacterium]MBM3640833.1 AI-2E family transporter [Alphaproteobacteria bacterium]
MAISREPAAQTDEDVRRLGVIEALSWRETVARLFLSATLVALGLYVLENYLRALAWALVLAVALWPLYDRARRQASPGTAQNLLPIVFTALVGLTIFLPVATLAVDAVRELRDLVAYGREAEKSGIPAPDFITNLPYVGQWIASWWSDHLSHAGWAKEIIAKVNTASLRELGANLGANVLHRAVIFGVCLLTLFFLFRHGESISTQCRAASRTLFGDRGERIALQMVASVHGTVAGLVLVGIGEGLLMGVVYFLTHLPHPVLFAMATAVAAMIPFAAGIAIGVAALILLGGGGIAPAIIVALAGAVVIFVADHFVRPRLIGGVTKLPFLWVLLGIFGGVERFQLLGLFLGPAIMAAVMLLWRELAAPADDPSSSLDPSG